jgi:peptide deformylase
MEGYKLPHGMSGANAGIPWNIIAVARGRGESGAWAEVMINPKIVDVSDEMIESESNCGSITLPEPIKIKRHAWVTVRYAEAEDDYSEYTRTFHRQDGGLTIQHEIDHNLGVTILDRQAH